MKLWVQVEKGIYAPVVKWISQLASDQPLGVRVPPGAQTHKKTGTGARLFRRKQTALLSGLCARRSHVAAVNLERKQTSPGRRFLMSVASLET